MTASTTLCRIMCAAGATYSINEHTCALPPSSDVYFVGSGLVNQDPPNPSTETRAYCKGDDKTNACLVGLTDDGVVVAFRGTLGFDIGNWPSVVDWIKNDLAGVPLAEAPELGAGVKVHSGWWGDLGTLWPDVCARVKQLLGAGERLLITGHSKGGPLAAMAAARFHAEGIAAAELTTFASPNPGNDAFAALFGGPGQPTSTNYENYGDIVPLVPPSGAEAWNFTLHFVGKLDLSFLEKAALGAAMLAAGVMGYEPVNGTVNYINPDFSVVSPPPSIEDRVENVLANYDAIGGAKAFAAAHCHGCQGPGCAGGYMGAACPGEICS